MTEPTARRTIRPSRWSTLNAPCPFFRSPASIIAIAAFPALPLMAMAAVETLIGTGSPGAGPVGQAPLDYRINSPFGVITAPDGSVIFCDTGNHQVLAVSPTATVSIVAGTGEAGYSGDGGPATNARLNEPYEIRLDASGNLYVVERLNHTIRLVSGRDGSIATLAGTGEAGYSGDGGPAEVAMFNQPHSIALGPDGENLYVCDIGNHRIRIIDLNTGLVDTFAGTGGTGPVVDGALFAKSDLAGPRCIVFDGNNTGWLSLREGRAIYRLDLETGTIHHISGTGRKGFAGDKSPARDATLSGPLGLALSPIDGNLYFCDTDNHVVRMIDLASHPPTIQTIAGNGLPGDGPDGPSLQCNLDRPHGITATRDGTLLIGDTNNHRIRAIRPDE